MLVMLQVVFRQQLPMEIVVIGKIKLISFVESYQAMVFADTVAWRAAIE